MMKIRLFLLLLLPIVAFSQKTVDSRGTIITQRDTLEVFFKLPVLQNGKLNYAALQHSVVIFKNKKDTLSVVLKAEQALQIDFSYRDEKIRMISTNNYFGFKSGLQKPILLFLKVETQGRATLCSYYDPDRNTSRQDFSAKHYYVLYQRGKTHLQISPAEAYLGITEFFYDCARFKDLNEEDITFENVLQWVVAYNKGDCDK